VLHLKDLGDSEQRSVNSGQCRKEQQSHVKMLKELEGPRGGGAWITGHRGIVPT